MENEEEMCVLNKDSIFLREKQKQLEDLKGKITTLYYESLKINSFKIQNTYSNDSEQQITCCNCHCHLFKCDAESQTFESDFENQASLEINSTHSALDWIADSNGNTTVAELVQDVIAMQQTQQNDYVYNTDYKMYYSSSTGYYYDSERDLFYEPYSQIYYKYNSENNSYDTYYHVSNDTEDHDTEVPPEKRELNLDETSKTPAVRKSKYKRSKKKESSVVKSEIYQKNPKEQTVTVLKLDDEEVNQSDDSSLEEGEVRSDSSGIMSPKNPNDFMAYSPASGQFEEGSSERWPPCIRAVVKESTHQKIGSLVLITCTGGVIGREKDSSICIPDISVSREHAQIVFDSVTWQYSIIDLGSQNSTFVNDLQVSDNADGGCEYVLKHGDILKLGSCKLLIHIHDGNNTCKDCEPGLIQAELDAKPDPIDRNASFKTKGEKEKERRHNVKLMKKKFGLKNMNFDPVQKSSSSKTYQDRSEQRRKEKGSQNPYEKTEQPVSLEMALPSTNKGYKMLKAMGWSEGHTLGVDETGITEPIPLHFRSGQSGLGSVTATVTPLVEGTSTSRRRKWEKVQERYNRIVESKENPMEPPTP